MCRPNVPILSYSDHKLYIATNKRKIYNTKFHKMLFSGSHIVTMQLNTRNFASSL